MIHNSHAFEIAMMHTRQSEPTFENRGLPIKSTPDNAFMSVSPPSIDTYLTNTAAPLPRRLAFPSQIGPLSSGDSRSSCRSFEQSDTSCGATVMSTSNSSASQFLPDLRWSEALSPNTQLEIHLYIIGCREANASKETIVTSLQSRFALSVGQALGAFEESGDDLQNLLTRFVEKKSRKPQEPICLAETDSHRPRLTRKNISTSTNLPSSTPNRTPLSRAALEVEHTQTPQIIRNLTRNDRAKIKDEVKYLIGKYENETDADTRIMQEIKSSMAVNSEQSKNMLEYIRARGDENDSQIFDDSFFLQCPAELLEKIENSRTSSPAPHVDRVKDVFKSQEWGCETSAWRGFPEHLPSLCLTPTVFKQSSFYHMLGLDTNNPIFQLYPEAFIVEDPAVPLATRQNLDKLRKLIAFYPLTGQLSPSNKITLPARDRARAMIPAEAVYYSWSYRIDIEWKSSSLDKDLVLNNLCNVPELFFLLCGGFVYFDKDMKVVQVNAMKALSKDKNTAVKKEGLMEFSEPCHFPAELIDNLLHADRLKPVTMTLMKEQNAKYYAWLRPNEILVAPNRVRTKFGPHGGFVFLFHDPTCKDPKETSKNKYYGLTSEEWKGQSSRSIRTIHDFEEFMLEEAQTPTVSCDQAVSSPRTKSFPSSEVPSSRLEAASQPIHEIVDLGNQESLFSVRRGTDSCLPRERPSEMEFLADVALQVAKGLFVKYKQCLTDNKQLSRSTTMGEELQKNPEILHIALLEFIRLLPKAALKVMINRITCSTCPQLEGVACFVLQSIRNNIESMEAPSEKLVAELRKMGAPALQSSITNDQTFQLKKLRQDQQGSDWFDKIMKTTFEDIVSEKNSRYQAQMDYIDRELMVKMLMEKFQFAQLSPKKVKAILESQMKEKNWVRRRELTTALASCLRSETPLATDPMDRYQTGLIPELIVDFLHPPLNGKPTFNYITPDDATPLQAVVVKPVGKPSQMGRLVKCNGRGKCTVKLTGSNGEAHKRRFPTSRVWHPFTWKCWRCGQKETSGWRVVDVDEDAPWMCCTTCGLVTKAMFMQKRFHKGWKVRDSMFGHLYTGFDAWSNKKVAIKRCYKSALGRNDMEDPFMEAELHKQIYDYDTAQGEAPPGIIGFVQLDEQEDHLDLIFPWADGNDLCDVTMKWQNRGEYTKKPNGKLMGRVQAMFKELCLGIQYLHDLLIVHRDISLENILRVREPAPKPEFLQQEPLPQLGLKLNEILNKHTNQRECLREMKQFLGSERKAREFLRYKRQAPVLRAKLTDFGAASQVWLNEDGEEQKFLEPLGKERYRSRECHYAGLENEGFDGKSNDIWCLGVCLFQMLIGAPPYKEIDDAYYKAIYESPTTRRRLVENYQRSHLVTPEAWEVLDHIFRPEAERASIDELLELSYLQDAPAPF